MSQVQVHPVPESFAKDAHINAETYQEMYRRSIEDSDKFWAEEAEKFIDWEQPWSDVSSYDFSTGEASWFTGGKLNVTVNCIDRHLATKADKTALIWEGDDPSQSEHISYQQLHDEVAKFANGLKKLGVKKGDRIAIYMPMSPQAVYAMQACARLGAIHSVVFGGFSPSAIADRIKDSGAKIVITSDEGRRAGNTVPLKANVDEAVAQQSVTTIEHVVVHQLTGGDVQWHEHDVWWHDLVADQAAECAPEPMNAEDPLFILYTSGSTGQPKGVVHTTGGYLVYASMTHEYVFDLKEDDIFWCSADVGWITGHSYIAYGPLVNGCTQVLFEGVPTYPTAGRMGEVVDKHKVTILYTAPTAIRALMAKGDEPTATSNRDSLRILGSVGEPINPEAWTWYYESIGKSNCPIVDTWWQTETGGIMITPLPGATDMKPGSATRPFFGIAPALFDAEGNTLEGAVDGNLVILDSWPSQARTVYGDHERFEQTYFSAYPGVYFTGDGCRRDEDGYYWITGRVDDVINVSGHRLSTMEVESALVSHEGVAEAAVVPQPDETTGQAIVAFVTMEGGGDPPEEFMSELRNHVGKKIGKLARPKRFIWADDLPKTRSGKIMRRLLRDIAAGRELGDVTTLRDPTVTAQLKQKVAARQGEED